MIIDDSVKRATVAVLNRAAQLVEGGWTQGVYARGIDGGECEWNSPEAASFCIEGAMLRAAGGMMVPADRAVRVVLERETGAELLSLYNDHLIRTKEEIVWLLREAATEVMAQ